MRNRFCVSVLIICLSFFSVSGAHAAFTFSDDRFQGIFTTENMDRIISEYELYDGWYWSTPPNVIQTFHGIQDGPGWTDTAVNVYHRSSYKKGLYGCRWLANKVFERNSNHYGRGECFGFASFIGYLLSGEYNPHKNWKIYYNLKSSSGLQVGDILRTEFTVRGKKYTHSAVVYSVSEEEILFIQVSGSTFNKIHLGTGFLDGYHDAPKTLEELAKLPNYKVCRSQLNMPASNPETQSD